MNDFPDSYIVALARQMRDDDVVHVGASQQEVWQAAKIASRLWAPGLRLIASCTYHLTGDGARDSAPVERTYARNLIASRQATFIQSRVFDDLLRHKVAFAGAMQIDRLGNANLIAVEGRHSLVRGPGSGGLPTLTSHSDRFFFAIPRHDARTLVERVDRISVLGNPAARARYKLPAHALRRVITPLAAFAHDVDHQLKLIEIDATTTIVEVIAKTGFEVTLHPEFAVRPGLSADEADALSAGRS